MKKITLGTFKSTSWLNDCDLRESSAAKISRASKNDELQGKNKLDEMTRHKRDPLYKESTTGTASSKENDFGGV